MNEILSSKATEWCAFKETDAVYVGKDKDDCIHWLVIHGYVTWVAIASESFDTYGIQLKPGWSVGWRIKSPADHTED